MKAMMYKKLKKSVTYEEFINGGRTGKPSHDLVAGAPKNNGDAAKKEERADAIQFDFFA